MRLESQLIAAINKPLPKWLHHQSNTSGSLTSNGIPDQYYDGPRADLWIEYKFLAAMPRNGLVGGVDAKKRGCYSPLQYAWMLRRWTHGSNVLGIVGLPNRTAVLQLDPFEWRHQSPISKAIKLSEVTTWIRNFCGR